MAVFPVKFVFFTFLLMVVQVIPIQLQLQEGEELKENNVDNSQLNECINGHRSTELGVCFGKELLHQLNDYEESDTFSLATGVSFVRDEKIPRDISSFLDRDPLDFRSMMEDASNLISKRSLHWDLSNIYPGLVMRIGPTLANGILEFVVDPRVKERAYNQMSSSQTSTGSLLARNLLVPFLLGFKFHISTLLPLLLGLLLLASKKAFFLAKIALIAVTLFSGGASYGGNNNYWNGLNGFGSSSPPSYGSQNMMSGSGSGSGSSGGYYSRHPHSTDYFYKEKSAEQSTASPITPDELRDRLERLFITKKSDEPRDEKKMRNARNFVWTPLNAG